MKFATKPIQNYPPHLRHVATLPWEIELSANIQQTWKKMQTSCIFVARLRYWSTNFNIFRV